MNLDRAAELCATFWFRTPNVQPCQQLRFEEMETAINDIDKLSPKLELARSRVVTEIINYFKYSSGVIGTSLIFKHGWNLDKFLNRILVEHDLKHVYDIPINSHTRIVYVGNDLYRLYVKTGYGLGYYEIKENGLWAC